MAIPLAQAYVELRAEDAPFTAAINRAASSVRSFLPALAALSGGLWATARATLEFDRAMQRLAVEFDVAGRAADELQAAIVNLALQFGRTVGETAAAADAIADAGFDAAESLRILEQAMVLARASGTAVATTAELLATALRAFGKEATEAQQVVNVLFLLLTSGRTSAEALRHSFARLAPLSASLGIAIEELAAALIILTRVTGDTTTAQTALISLLKAFLEPTKQLQKLLEQQGYATGRAIIATEGLAGALAFLTRAAQRVPIEELIEDFRGLPGIAALGAREIRELEEILRRFATGAVDAGQAAARMGATFSEALGRLRVQFELFLSAVGTPLLSALNALFYALEPLLFLLRRLGEFVMRLTFRFEGAEGAVRGWQAFWGAIIAGISALAITKLPFVSGVFARLFGTATGPMTLAISALISLSFMARATTAQVEGPRWDELILNALLAAGWAAVVAKALVAGIAAGTLIGLSLIAAAVMVTIPLAVSFVWRTVRPPEAPPPPPELPPLEIIPRAEETRLIEQMRLLGARALAAFREQLRYIFEIPRFELELLTPEQQRAAERIFWAISQNLRAAGESVEEMVRQGYLAGAWVFELREEIEALFGWLDYFLGEMLNRFGEAPRAFWEAFLVGLGISMDEFEARLRNVAAAVTLKPAPLPIEWVQERIPEVFKDVPDAIESFIRSLIRMSPTIEDFLTLVRIVRSELKQSPAAFLTFERSLISLRDQFEETIHLADRVLLETGPLAEELAYLRAAIEQTTEKPPTLSELFERMLAELTPAPTALEAWIAGLFAAENAAARFGIAIQEARARLAPTPRALAAFEEGLRTIAAEYERLLELYPAESAMRRKLAGELALLRGVLPAPDAMAAVVSELVRTPTALRLFIENVVAGSRSGAELVANLQPLINRLQASPAAILALWSALEAYKSELEAAIPIMQGLGISTARAEDALRVLTELLVKEVPALETVLSELRGARGPTRQYIEDLLETVKSVEEFREAIADLYRRVVREGPEAVNALTSVLERTRGEYEAMIPVLDMFGISTEEASRRLTFLAAVALPEAVAPIEEQVRPAWINLGEVLLSAAEDVGLVSEAARGLARALWDLAVASATGENLFEAAIRMIVEALRWAQRVVEEARARVQELATAAWNAVLGLWSLFSTSTAFAKAQELWAFVMGQITDALFSWVWVLVAVLEELGFAIEEVTGVVEDTAETFERILELNVPEGFKMLARRLEYLAARPGEPYRPPAERRPAPGAPARPEVEIPGWIRDIVALFKTEITALGDTIKAIIVTLAEAAQILAPAFLQLLLPVFQTFADSVLALATWLRDVGAPILTRIFTALGAWWQTEVDPWVKSELLPALQAALTSILNFLAAEVLPFLTGPFWTFLTGELWPKIQEIATSIWEKLQEIWGYIEEHWDEIKGLILRYIEDIGLNLQKGLDIWLADLKARSGDLWGALRTIWESESLTLWEKVGLTFHYLKEPLLAIGLVVAGLILVFGGFGAAVSSVGIGLLAIIGIVALLGAGVGQIISGLAQGLGSFLGGLASGLGSFIGGLASGLGSLLGGLASGLGSLLGGLASGLGAFLGGLASGLGSVIGGLLNAVSALLSGIASVVRTFLDLLLAPIRWLLGLIGIRLQEGGLVTRPTFALVGEAGPELVIPLPEVKSWFMPHRAEELELALINVVHVEVDGREIAAAVKRQEWKAQILMGRR